MTPDTVNLITKWVVIGPWLLWLGWELVLLWLRQRGLAVETISMEAKRIAYLNLGALAYFWSGMTSHYFLTWHRPTWTSPAPAVAFWCIGGVYLVADLLDRGHWFGWPLVVQWLRYPPVVAVVGLVAGFVLFPQGAPTWSPGAK